MIIKRRVITGATWWCKIMGEYMCCPYPEDNIFGDSNKLVGIIEEQEKEIIIGEAVYLKEDSLPTCPIHKGEWKTVGVGILK